VCGYFVQQQADFLEISEKSAIFAALFGTATAIPIQI
jgi:hypothetical protein